jgi:hypothetical protein
MSAQPLQLLTLIGMQRAVVLDIAVREDAVHMQADALPLRRGAKDAHDGHAPQRHAWRVEGRLCSVVRAGMHQDVVDVHQPHTEEGPWAARRRRTRGGSIVRRHACALLSRHRNWLLSRSGATR